MRQFRIFLLSFKFKIAFTVTTMVLIAAAGVGGVSLLIAESGMRQAIAGQQLSMLASAAAYIDNDLQGKQQLLRSIGEQAQGRAQGHDFPLNQVQALLESHGTLRDAFYNVTAFTPDGKLIANLADRSAIGTLNAANRQYFKDTLASREGLISPAFKSALSGKPIVVITQPVENAQGQIIWVLVGAIDLQRPSFSGQLEALHATLDGYLFIVAADGTAIHHPDKEQILSRNSAISSTLTDAVLDTPEGWRDDLLDDEQPVLLSHRRLRRVDWTIAVSSPLHKVFAPMLSVRLRTLGATSLLTALAGLFAWVLVKLLVLPLARLHQNIDDISAGKAGIDVFDIAREDEFGALSRAFYTLSQHQAETERDLHRLATTDALTGANNRRMFDAYFPTALARAHRAGQQVGLAILDVDKFKAINDTHGHAAGDAVLVEFARRLMRTVRCTDTVARLAGDEFVIVYEQLGAATEINILGNKILDAMAAPFQIGDQLLPVTVSVGIALTTSTPATVDDVIRAADQALYGVKAAGRNGFAINYVGAERVVRSRARPAKEAGQEQVQAV